jgi:hypothetical protein
MGTDTTSGAVLLSAHLEVDDSAFLRDSLMDSEQMDSMDDLFDGRTRIETKMEDIEKANEGTDVPR